MELLLKFLQERRDLSVHLVIIIFALIAIYFVMRRCIIVLVVRGSCTIRMLMGSKRMERLMGVYFRIQMLCS